MSGELLKAEAGIDIVHVPYQGGGPMLNAVIGGQIPVGFDNLPSSAGHIKSGSVRALAVTTSARSPDFPDIPTIAESGVKGYEVSAWFGILAPAHTPAPVVDKLNKAIVAILKEPDVAKRFQSLGANPVGDTPQDFAARIKAEVAKWQEVVRKNKMQQL
jgi:tripartite-type tricarboxylate transporter receptor subunit TctC